MGLLHTILYYSFSHLSTSCVRSVNASNFFMSLATVFPQCAYYLNIDISLHVHNISLHVCDCV